MVRLGDHAEQRPGYTLISSASRWRAWLPGNGVVGLGGCLQDSVGRGGTGSRRSLGMSWSGSGWVRVARVFRPCYRALRMTVRRVAKQHAPSVVRKPPEMFWRSLSILRSLSASLSVNGTRGS